MELSEQTLEQYLNNDAYTFRVGTENIKFYSRYETLKNKLLAIHSQVTQGAIISSIRERLTEYKKQYDELKNNSDNNSNEELKLLEEKIFEFNEILWLNDHGPEHIESVIKRAGQLLSCKKIELTPREVYCLLCAIQIHDIGNIYSRIDHESNIGKILNEKGVYNDVGTDNIEKRHIMEIASVHGGKVPNTDNKDTISTISKSDYISDEPVRLQLLASILRMSDELAENRYRGSQDLIKEKPESDEVRTNSIPKASEVYHAYSSCVANTVVEHHSQAIKVHYDIPKKFITEKLGKGDSEVYLIDEIYNRTLKMYLEKKYCSRFWKPEIDIDSITVIMTFYHDDFTFGKALPDATYTLKETGYPKYPNDIFDFCPDLVKDGNRLDGEYYKNKSLEDGK